MNSVSVTIDPGFFVDLNPRFPLRVVQPRPITCVAVGPVDNLMHHEIVSECRFVSFDASDFWAIELGLARIVSRHFRVGDITDLARFTDGKYHGEMIVSEPPSIVGNVNSDRLQCRVGFVVKNAKRKMQG